MRGAIAKKSTKDGDWRQVFPDRAGAWSLLLNKDPDTKGRTIAVRYTEGWEVPESVHDGTVEVLVLEGQFQVGPIVYGLRSRRRRARAGARPHRRADRRDLPRAPHPGAVGYLATLKRKWQISPSCTT